MKLAQDDIKKIGLCALGMGVVIWAYFAFLLGPLEDNEKKSVDGIAALEPQISDANTQLKKTADLEKQAPLATQALTALKATLPDGAPIAWFPPRMDKFFKRHGINKCSVRLVNEEAGSDLPGFRRLQWAIEIPRVEFIPFGQAVASLENEEPLLTVLSVTVEATREDAQHQHCVLMISTLVKS